MSEIEEDVHGPADHTEKETNDPHAESHDGHVWVIDIGDGSTYFGKRTVLFVDGVKVKLHLYRTVSAVLFQHAGSQAECCGVWTDCGGGVSFAVMDIRVFDFEGLFSWTGGGKVDVNSARGGDAGSGIGGACARIAESSHAVRVMRALLRSGRGGALYWLIGNGGSEMTGRTSGVRRETSVWIEGR